MLRAVDISRWQAGIDPASLDCDAVIVKATGGVSYENIHPEVGVDWREWADAVLASGRLLGLYHFAWEANRHGTAQQEARHFLDAISDYKGKCIPILDWENDALSLPASWAREWLDIVASEMGATPMFYAGASDLNSKDYSSLTKYPLWMASYLNRYDGAGWVDDPANTWGTGDWDSMLMYQYTSTGLINGWPRNLDLSVFYGTEYDWLRLEGKSVGSVERMVSHAVSIAEDDYYGYSWADRWDHDRDCSSLMYDSADAAGYPVGRGPDKTRYTGTMIEDFTAAGFSCNDFGSVILKRGDILLRDPWGEGGHTEMYIGNGQCVGAHSSETGGVYGQPGDQTGNEISITAMWGSWDYVLRPPEGSTMGEWIEKDGKWWYRHDDGSFTADDWEYISGNWYFFDAEGWMVTGWLYRDGEWYYLKKSGDDCGRMMTGWVTLTWHGKRCRFYFRKERGSLLMDGFYKIDGRWYAMDSNGVVVQDDSAVKVNAKNGRVTIKDVA